jgi:multidrug efflux pump subunit AcrA (membrane-fusion protein)
MWFAALVIVLLGEVRLSADDTKAPLPADVVVYKVGFKDLQLKVIERGTVEAKNRHNVICDVKTGALGAPKLKWVVDNGSRVKKGDLLVEIDASSLQEAATNQQILRDKAEAEKTAAELILANKAASLRLEKARGTSAIKSAESDVEEAKLDLTKFEEGELDAWRKEVKGRMAQAEADVQLWRERIILGEKRLREGKTTEGLVKAMRQKLEACTAVVESAKTQSDVVEKFSIPQRRNLLKKRVELAELVLEQERVGAPLRLKNAEAELKTAEQDLKIKQVILAQQQALHKDLLEQIDHCTIRAELSGVVVYHVPEPTRTGRVQSPSIIAQGEAVRYGQILLTIPDLTHMVVNVRFPEAVIHHVKKGLPCQVLVDALPARVLNGKVTAVSAVASPQDSAAPDVKVYQTWVEITDPVEGLNLKPGLSAVVMITTQAKAEHVLAVPVESVLGLGDKTKKARCLVIKPGGVEEREVAPGLSDGRMVEIKAGLKEGDEVVNDRRVLPADRSRPRLPAGPEK